MSISSTNEEFKWFEPEVGQVTLQRFQDLLCQYVFVNQEVVFLADQDFFGSLPGVELALHYL